MENTKRTEEMKMPILTNIVWCPDCGHERDNTKQKECPGCEERQREIEADHG